MNNYTDYPFVANGVNFVSRVFNDSPMAKQIAMLPKAIFAEMNINAVASLIGNASLLTREELLSELEKVNEGGTHAFILLGDN